MNKPNSLNQSHEPRPVGVPLTEPERGSAESAGFCLFLLDRTVVEAAVLAEVLTLLDIRGFDVLLTRSLDPEAQARAGEMLGTRQGEEQAVCPGDLVVTLNLEPRPPSAVELHSRPQLDDAAIFYTEAGLNRLVDRRLSRQSQAYTLVRACENAARSWELVRAFLPDDEADLRVEVERRRRAYQTPFPVIRRLGSGGERAKVELVWYQGKAAVCKVFRPGRERFFQSELTARRDLSEQIGEIAELIDHGENWILSPYYDNTFVFNRNPFRLLSLSRAKQLVAVLEKLYRAGYASMDFTLNNVVFDRTSGLKVIDSEYLYKYEQRPARFEESYDIVGVPEALRRDRTIGRPGRLQTTYANKLQPYIGLSLESLLHDPLWKQHLKRAWYTLAVLWPRSLQGRARSSFHRAREQLLRLLLRI